MLNKLKSWFVEDDGETVKKSPPKTQENKQSKAAPTKSSPSATPKKSATSAPASSPSPKVQGKPDSKFVDVLLKAIEANNLDGFDYLEYKQSLQNLSSMAMDEKTKYQSAFAMAKTMGVTPQKLVESANHYVNVLQKEKNKFGEALSNQKQNQIVSKENELKQMEQGILQKEKQIEQLKAEIEKHKSALQGRKDAINQAATKVETTKANFLYAFNMVMGQIKADVDNMKKYIS